MKLSLKCSALLVAAGLAGFPVAHGQAQGRKPDSTASASQGADMDRWSAPAAGLETQHPAAYYARAKSLFQSGRRDEAVFLFYLGQLRYRIHLKANPDLPQDRDAALFSSLSEEVGRPINEYAFGDIPMLARIIEAVLAFDETQPDRFTARASSRVRQEIRQGLAEMRAAMLSQADAIRAQRTKKGLQNRN